MKTKIYKYQIGQKCIIANYVVPNGTWKIDRDSKVKTFPIPKLKNRYKTRLWKLNRLLENL